VGRKRTTRRFPLKVMDNTPIKGEWELVVQDTSSGETSGFNSWPLNVIGGRKYLTK
jgi:subtilisin-like proprotein convertase family protein